MKQDQNTGNGERELQVVPLIPTVDVVVFPQMVVPLLVLDEKVAQGVNNAMENEKEILLLAAHETAQTNQQPIGPQDLHSVGTIGRVMRVMTMPDGGMKVLVQGLRRASVIDLSMTEDELTATVEGYDFVSEGQEEEVELKMKSILAVCEKISSIGGVFNHDFQVIFSQIDDYERAIDFLLSHLSLTVTQSQSLLEKQSLSGLLEELYGYLQSEIESSQVQERVRLNARDSINRSQREYYLREQLKAIQRELGDDSDTEVQELRTKLENQAISDEARQEAERQLRRLERTSPDSLEATVIRNHLEWLLTLPWGVSTKDNLDIVNAKDVLDTAHYGLERIKERILDFLSVKTFQKTTDSPVLCFSGPPGVGKTSLGKSIAECLGRKFFRVSLGGMHDESELRGHRRTYVGALPGRIVQALQKSGSSNPVVMLDEIDKVGSSGKGDPAAALLEILDPEQNANFYDNYLGVHYDLSKIMFIATSNDLSCIPEPLRDRMDIIELSGYTTEEKVQIAKSHLAPRAIEKSGLQDKGLEISEDVLRKLAESYTREAGVRTLARYVSKLCSKFARYYLENQKPFIFTPDNLDSQIGPERVTLDRNILRDRIGVTNGLAWTPVGGEVLQVEAVLMPGGGKLILTGQLGDVMRESAQAAVSYIRSKADRLGISKDMFAEHDLHIHLPAGAVPKDGPSAGITLLSSILSVVTKRPVDGSFAMTGEVDLQGGVLPIGGVKEKILAAKQYGLTNVIIPEQNRKDLQEIRDVTEGITIHLVSHIEEVVDRVLRKSEETATAA